MKVYKITIKQDTYYEQNVDNINNWFRESITGDVIQIEIMGMRKTDYHRLQDFGCSPDKYCIIWDKFMEE